MLLKQNIVEKVTEIVERAGRKAGIEPVEVELLGGGGTRVLRIYIDKPEGVTHADCEMISDYVGTVLDVEDVVPGGRYTLEVSSPGLERKLTTEKDFQRFAGQNVKVVLREPVDGSKVWQGKLAGCENGFLTVEPSGKAPVRIALNQVSRANLKFEW